MSKCLVVNFSGIILAIALIGKGNITSTVFFCLVNLNILKTCGRFRSHFADINEKRDT